MDGHSVNRKEAEKILLDNGFIFVRQTGGHRIYKNNIGQSFVITQGRISQKTWKRECRKVGIEC